MITKYYKVTVSSEINNNFHDFINASKAVILELEENKPMYFCYYLPKDLECHWHRVITTNVIKITKENNCITTLPPINQEIIKVYTENSSYTFTNEDQEGLSYDLNPVFDYCTEKLVGNNYEIGQYLNKDETTLRALI